jgi:hypothetical protein
MAVIALASKLVTTFVIKYTLWSLKTKHKFPWLMLPRGMSSVEDGFDAGLAKGYRQAKISGRQATEYVFLCNQLKVNPMATRLGRNFVNVFSTRPGIIPSNKAVSALVEFTEHTDYREMFVAALIDEGAILPNELNYHLPMGKDTSLEMWLKGSDALNVLDPK